MSASQTQSLDERAHWQVRAVLLLAIVAAIFLVRELVGSRSLRIAPEPQRIALVDAPQQQPPTRDELPIQPAVPEEQAAPPSDGMDNTPTLGDLGPSPIDDQLGVDSDAQAGFDNFGLRAKRGGRDLALDLGKPERAFGGGGGSGGFGTYSSLVAGELKSWLSADEELRRSNYQVRVQVWLDPAGTVSHCKLADTTGDTALDRRLVDRISTACIRGAPLPKDLPQPITVLIRSHGAGM